MRFQIIFVLGLIALASTSPLVDKKSSSLKVIDIPADLFADASENEEKVDKPEEPVVADKTTAAAVPASETEKDSSVAVSVDKLIPVELGEKVEEEKKEGDKTDKNVGDIEDGERPGIFGFRLPTVVILRRPAIFDDPFSFFPFSISSINRRPSFGGPDTPQINRDSELEPRPDSSIAAPSLLSEQRPTVNVGDLMHNVRQQMDSLFSSLFAPGPALFPNRQFFPRPFFPSVPSDASSEDDDIDFAKLPDNYNNSTSETKVVDGQVIQVNKTTHRISGNNSNGFFHFSVIKIRPSEVPTTEEKAPEEAANGVPPAAIESAAADEKRESTTKAQEAEMNNPSLNEVLDQDEKETMIANTKYETDPGLLEEPTATATGPVALPLTQEVIFDFVPLKSMPIIEARETKGNRAPHDLSSDLRVNNLMANFDNARLRALVDPDDVEVIAV